MMLSLVDQNGLGQMLFLSRSAGYLIVGLFVLAMSLVLWNSGLMSTIRRYGEIGVRLAIGESKKHIFMSFIIESIMIGLIGSAIGTLLGLLVSYYLQVVGVDIGPLLKNSKTLYASHIRAKITVTSFYIGFIPGLFASVFGMMIAALGIYKRQTASLFKELEV